MGKKLIVVANVHTTDPENSIMVIDESDFSSEFASHALLPELLKYKERPLPIPQEVLKYRLPKVKEACKKRYDNETDAAEHFKKYEDMLSVVERFEAEHPNQFLYFYLVEE